MLRLRFPDIADYLIKHHTNDAKKFLNTISAQLHRRGSTMSNVPAAGLLGKYEIRGLLLCFLHIVRTLSDGKHTLLSS